MCLPAVRLLLSALDFLRAIHRSVRQAAEKAAKTAHRLSLVKVT